MKRFIKIIFRTLSGFVSLGLAVLFAAGVFFGIKGYHMYQDAVENMPISEKAAAIRGMDHFVE